MQLFLIQMSIIMCAAGHSSRKFETQRYAQSDIVSFPFVASMVLIKEFSHNNKAQLKCGCIIIQKFWVLTSAFCLSDVGVQQDMDLGKVIIRGNTSFYDCRDNFCKDHHVNYYYAHDSYIEGLGIKNDNIGIVQVQEPFNGTSERPIMLPPKNYQVTDDSKAMGIVWEQRRSQNEHPGSTRFHRSFFKVKNFQDCEFHSNTTSEKLVFCAVAKQPEISKCYTSSGGALIQGHYVIGIAALYVECGIKPIPGLFTKVPAYIDWITNSIKDFEKQDFKR